MSDIKCLDLLVALLTHLTGNLSSLKSHRKDVTEMRKGSECGISFEGFTDFKIGDQVQCYEEKFEKRTL